MRILLSVGSLAVVTGLIFYYFPGIDLAVSKYFYDLNGGQFIPKDSFPFNIIYISVRPVYWGLIAVFSFMLVMINIFKRNSLGLDNRKVLFILFTLLIGPGVIVHDVFKDNWGRARPHQIVEFGGEKQFTPAFVMSDQCDVNCSFVSGHAAIGFYLTAFAYIFHRHRKLAITTGLVYGGLETLTRLVQGGHFLSDCIMAGFLIILINHVTAIYVFKRVRKQEEVSKL